MLIHIYTFRGVYICVYVYVFILLIYTYVCIYVNIDIYIYSIGHHAGKLGIPSSSCWKHLALVQGPCCFQDMCIETCNMQHASAIKAKVCVFIVFRHLSQAFSAGISAGSAKWQRRERAPKCISLLQGCLQGMYTVLLMWLLPSTLLQLHKMSGQ